MEHIKNLMPKKLATQKGTSSKNTEISSQSKCPYCHDDGVVHPTIDGRVDYSRAVACICRKKEVDNARYEALLRYCDLPPMVGDMRFDNFDVYPEVNNAYKQAKEIASKPGNLWWTTFQGVNDTGKTHLAIAICKAWIEKGIAAKYAFVPLLLDELREGFKRTDNDDYSQRFDRFCNVPLLVLDDLGMESKTPWVQEKLETLVDYRYMHKLSLVVTTNNTLEELSPRISSRLVRHPNAKIITIAAREYTLRRMK